MKTESDTPYLIVTINQEEYLIFPEALKFIGLGEDRSVLHQRILRNNVDGVIKRSKYVFVPMTYCKEMKKEIEAKNALETLKEVGSEELAVIKKMREMGLTLNDLEQIKKKKGTEKK